MLADTLARALTYIEFRHKTLEEYASELEYDMVAARQAWQECIAAFEVVEREEYLITTLAKHFDI